MPIEEVPTCYRTEDGHTFPTEAEAARHESLVEARARYLEARRLLGRRLAETERTADDAPFEFDVYRDYWYLSPGWDGMPGLSRVHFSGWGVDFREQDDGSVTLRQNDDRSGQPRDYRIRDLYRHHRPAEQALLAAVEAWLAERAAEVEALRRRLKGGG